MRTRPSPLTTALFLATTLGAGALATTAAMPAARASHYAFARVDLVTALERKALSRAGIFDTNMLLAWTASADRRAWLADTTAISYERLSELATMCDLLRVEGIGPVMVGALQKAGLLDTQALADSLPQPVVDKLRVVTRGTSVAQRLPDPDTVRTWISAAKRLRPILEGTNPGTPLR